MIVTIQDDFDLYKIAHSGQCFRATQEADNTYRFITGENILHIAEISDNDDSDKTFEVSCTKDEWDKVWFEYFDLGTDYKQIRASISNEDTYLKDAALLGKGIRILKQDKFETLISFIISQRKSIPAIKKSVELLACKYGKKAVGEEVHFFPTANELCSATAEELAECGLGYRVPYIMKVTKQIKEETVNLNAWDALPDEELVTTLKSIYGVGDKVANCVALFSYHRTGLAPIDTWIRKIIDTKYSGINPFSEYGNIAGIMQQYMFYRAQHLKGE